MNSYSLLGNYDYFMQKEIFEQPESIVNTMRGRVNFDTYKGMHVYRGIQLNEPKFKFSYTWWN